MIPELDRICPECAAPYLTAATTTPTTWLGHCPSCGWQGWQELPNNPPTTPNQSRPQANSPRHEHPTNSKRSRNPLQAHAAASKRNLPLDPRTDSRFQRRRRTRFGVDYTTLKPWPAWVQALAAVLLAAFLFAVVAAHAWGFQPSQLTTALTAPHVTWHGPEPTQFCKHHAWDEWECQLVPTAGWEATWR